VISHRPARLWKNAQFLKLWTAQSVSLVGSNVSGFALPTIAVLMLGASAGQMAFITIAQAVAFPLLGLPAAVVVERSSKRGMMIAMDAGRMTVLGAIPIAYACGKLSVVWLAVSAILVAAMSCFHDIAYQATLPSVVSAEDVIEGNAKLEFSNGLSQSLGPGIGGVLSHCLGAPAAVLIDAFSYCFSACSIASMKSLGSQFEKRPCQASALADVGEGFRWVASSPDLRRIAFSSATLNLALGMAQVANLIFFYRVLHFSAVALGGVLALSNIGAAGVAAAGPLERRLGTAATLAIAVAGAGLSRCVLSVSGVAWPLATAFAAMSLTALSLALYNVVQVSFRQQATPVRLRARMHATMRVLNSITLPLGAALGALCVTAFGALPTVAATGLITASAAAWFLPALTSKSSRKSHDEVDVDGLTSVYAA
jgi:hypothetical protein